MTATSRESLVIDAHAHVVDRVAGVTGTGATRSGRYGKIVWGNNELQLLTPATDPTTFPPEMLIAHLDWAGVDRAVLLQGSFYGELNAYVAEAVDRFHPRLVGAALVDPTRRDAVRELRRCFDEYGYRVVKLELSVATGLRGLHPDLHLDDERLLRLFREAAEVDAVVTLDLGSVGSASYETEALERIINRFPSLRIVIAHLAQPPVGKSNPELIADWEKQLHLGESGTVWFDLSSLPAYAAADLEMYPYRSAQWFVQRATAVVGSERLMWGSDVPGTLTAATYPQLLAFVADECEFLSDEQRKDILGRTALRVYFAGLE